mgnify:CR=1 FL=1
MKVIVFSLGILLCASCASKSEVETVSLEDLLPQSDYPILNKDEQKSDSLLFSDFKKDLMNAISDSSLLFSEEIYNVKFFPDRLSHITRHQELIILDSDSIAFTAWEFSDSLTTINAFYNWLDCFGDNCSEIKIGEEVKFSKNNVLTLVSNHHLVYITSTRAFNMIKWQNEIVPAIFPDELWIYAISQPAKKKGKWQDYEK